jgi:hypothetical protein
VATVATTPAFSVVTRIYSTGAGIFAADINGRATWLRS